MRRLASRWNVLARLVYVTINKNHITQELPTIDLVSSDRCNEIITKFYKYVWEVRRELVENEDKDDDHMQN